VPLERMLVYSDAVRGDISGLIEAGRLTVGAELYHRGRSGETETVARVTRGGIEVDGTIYSSLSTAAVRLAGHPTNGWTFWRLRETGRPIAEIRAET
jgi:hypothetical protein